MKNGSITILQSQNSSHLSRRLSAKVAQKQSKTQMSASKFFASIFEILNGIFYSLITAIKEEI